MTELSDTQAILLSTAAQRETLSILPLAESLKTGSAVEAIATLIRRGFALERPTQSSDTVHRVEDDVRYGVFATPTGLAAIGIDAEDDVIDPSPPAPPAAAGPRQTKALAVITLLQRASGATLAELRSATGWLPHTIRAALTGLRKKGHAIERSKRDDATCYRIIAG